MSQSSPTLSLPYLQASQAQKHVTHNEALKILDAVTQLSVLAADLIDPPSAPNEGDCYIPAPGPTGDWAGRGGDIAIYVDGTWQFFEARQGWRADVTPTGQTLRFNGTVWTVLEPELQNLPELGVNATADATNRLAVASEATLLTHDGDDHQLKINKAGATDTASLLFQTGFSGRAEMGTAGDDNFSIKVSPDGSSFTPAMVVDKDDGTTAVAGLASLKANLAPVSSTLFTPGGVGAVSVYRINGTSASAARSVTIDTVSSDTITLTGADADLIFDTTMGGVSFARIWNMSKATPESAWVMAQPASNQLQVTDASDISGWTGMETLQIGDPSGFGMGGGYIAIDISPMLVNLFGQSFPQTGIIFKSGLFNGSPDDRLRLTPDGTSGSFVTCAQEGANIGTTLLPTTVPSPISNSNLVGIRETISTTAGVRLLSSVAVTI